MNADKQDEPVSAVRPWWGCAGDWLWRHPRFAPLVILLVCFVVGFGLQRALLMGLFWPYLREASSLNLTKVFAVGLRYDLRAWGYVCIPLLPLLTLLPSAQLSRRWTKVTVRGYMTLTLTLMVAVNIVDALFFYYLSGRMNSLVPNYLGHAEVLWHLWDNYPVIPLVLMALALLAAVYWLLSRIVHTGLVAPAGGGRRFATFAAMGAVLFLATRGSLGHPSFDSSLAYFSSNNVMVELSMNSGCTLAVALNDYFTRGEDEDLHYPPMSPGDAFVAAREALAGPGMTFHDAPANPLWRTVDTGRPRRDLNVVVIVMESFSGRQVGALGYGDSQTPFFDSLATRGLYFGQMFAAGQRTSRGLAAVLCGYPDLGGWSILERRAQRGGFCSLSGLFAQRDYRTMFFYGGNCDFDNMRQFFCANDVQEIHELAEMPKDAWRTHWGVGDHTLLEQAVQRFDAAGDKPFFATILTLTNHQPYDVPPGCIDAQDSADMGVKMTNTLRYADWSLQRFFERAAGRPWFNNTIFVLVADHGVFVPLTTGRRTFDPRLLIDVEAYRIPCLIYSPALPEIAGRRYEPPCSQTDVSPTLLGLLGGQYSHCLLGRDLLSCDSGQSGWALVRSERKLAVVQGDLALMLPPDCPPLLFRRLNGGDLEQLDVTQYADMAGQMQRRAMGLFYSAVHLYRTKAYRDPYLPALATEAGERR